MSAITQRMNKLRDLTLIRNGPGAAILPKTVTKLHLEFAHKFDNGHAGPRKFWKQHLTSLKYHNPTVPMIVNRTRDQRIMPTLTIYMTSGSAADQKKPLLEAPSEGAIQVPKKAVATVLDPWQHITSSSDGSTPPPEARPGETAVKIKLRDVLADDIWRQFVQKTGAKLVEPSAADLEEMEKVSVWKAKSEVDRRIQQGFRNKVLEERARLEKARQEAEAVKAE